jgi:putative endonuclease
MQEVGGSIPPGSTTLRLRLRVAQPPGRRRSVPGRRRALSTSIKTRSAARGAAALSKAKRARRSPTGEHGLHQRALSSPVAAKSCIIRQSTLGWSSNVVRLRHPEHHVSRSEYTGATEDLKTRMPDHNAGKSVHTAKYIPWKLIWYCAFPDKLKDPRVRKILAHSQKNACSSPTD